MDKVIPNAEHSAKNEVSGTGETRSVLNALLILEILSGGNERKSLAELSRLINAPKTSTLRILSTLQAHDYVERDGASKSYALGPRAAGKSNQRIDSGSLISVAAEILSETAITSGETSHLNILDRTEVVTLSYVEGPSRLRTMFAVGERCPAHSVASGIAMMASGRDTEMQLVVANGLHALTNRTITSVEVLHDRVAEAKRNGFAYVQGEWSLDLGAVSAPVYGRGPAAIAALGVSGPIFRFADEEIPRIGRYIREQAAALSATLRNYTVRI